ncbi:MAG: SMC-Scp complex subunit ScpB [Gammaproteobacteria bacterium]|nr:SMC-Scp complex subunit ScpB [Gammaproteobacteria bacterium]
MELEQIQRIIEGALLASDGPLTVANLVKLFSPGELDEENGSKQVREAIKFLQSEAASRGVELKRVASGYRYQVRQELSPWVSRLWDEKPPRYTRALLETLSLIAYKQPVTRGDIEQIRGVSVSQNIMRTLVEREWIKVVGQREVPGRPSLYGTTKVFLDYFNLSNLDELPPLAEIRALIEPVVEDGPMPPVQEIVAQVDMPGDDMMSGDDTVPNEAEVELSTGGAKVVQLHTSVAPKS